jgi:hypothetical protein
VTQHADVRSSPLGRAYGEIFERLGGFLVSPAFPEIVALFGQVSREGGVLPGRALGLP